MDEEAALLAAVAAHPDDDLPRLAYADWLEDHAGDLPDPDAARLRAEFIRVLCEIARVEHLPSPDLQQYVHLYRRQDDLLTNHRGELLGPLADDLGPHDAVFDRGFLAEINLPADDFLEHAGVMVGLKPPRVRIWAAGRVFNELATRPELGCVTDLSIGGIGGGAFGFTLDPGCAAELGSCPYLRRLEVLSLEGCRVSDSALEAWASFAADGNPSLRELDLSNNDLTDDGVRWLVGSWLWTRLDRLILGGNPLTDAAAAVLADAAEGCGLSYLNLRFSYEMSNQAYNLLVRVYGEVGRTKLDIF